HLCHGRSGLPADGEAERLRGEPAMASLLRRHRQRLAIVARRAQGLRGAPRMSESPRDGAGFIKALGLRDVILMNVVAVVGMRWIARGARTGPESVPLWILAWIAFLVPHAVAISSLARQYPEQGGIYAVTRGARAGPESVPLWILAWIAFLVPHAVAISSLARKYPEQGGIYAWTRRAF